MVKRIVESINATVKLQRVKSYNASLEKVSCQTI